MNEEFKTGDSVYVNGRKGVILNDLPDEEYSIKTVNTGYIGTYHRDKIIIRHRHCTLCNRRISSKNSRCKHCRQRAKE